MTTEIRLNNVLGAHRGTDAAGMAELRSLIEAYCRINQPFTIAVDAYGTATVTAVGQAKP